MTSKSSSLYSPVWSLWLILFLLFFSDWELALFEDIWLVLLLPLSSEGATGLIYILDVIETWDPAAFLAKFISGLLL